MSFKKYNEIATNIVTQAGGKVQQFVKTKELKGPYDSMKRYEADIFDTGQRVVVQYRKVVGMKGDYEMFVVDDRDKGISVSFYNPNIELVGKMIRGEV